jgi:WD40 repeat protein
MLSAVQFREACSRKWILEWAGFILPVLAQVVTLSPDESVVACGTDRGGLDLIRLEDGQTTTHVAAHAGMVTEIVYHPSGRYLVTNSRDHVVTLWQIGPSCLTELLIISTRSGHAVSELRFSPDGRLLGILVPKERAVRVWDLVRLRKELATLGLDWKDEALEPELPTRLP